MELPTDDEIKTAVKHRFGLEIEEVCVNHTIIGTVSLTDLGYALIGSVMVYRDRNGKNYAVGVPYGLDFGLKKAS